MVRIGVYGREGQDRCHFGKEECKYQKEHSGDDTNPSSDQGSTAVAGATTGDDRTPLAKKDANQQMRKQPGAT